MEREKNYYYHYQIKYYLKVNIQKEKDGMEKEETLIAL